MLRTPARFRLPLLLLAALALAGCPTGNGDENEDPAGEGPPDASDPLQPVTISGTSGLEGGELKMRMDFASDSDSGHQQLLLSSDAAVDRGNRCRGGRGQGRGVPAGPGQAECATVTYTVDGLLGAGLIVGLVSEVVINGNVEFIVVEEDHIGEDGEYTFDTWLAPGEPYKVKVVQIPVDPDQFCPVKNAEGSVAGDVTDVEIVCGGPVRTWRFDDTTTLPDTDEATLDTHEPLAGDVLFRGVLSEGYKFQEGPAIPLGLLADLDVTELFKTYLDRPGGDGMIFSNLSGKTYWLAVESPQLNFDNPSHHARLDTEWRLRKESESSDFKLTVTHVNMLAYNDVYSRANAFGGFLWTGGQMRVRAYRVNNNGSVAQDPFYDAYSGIFLKGDTDPEDVQFRTTKWELIPLHRSAIPTHIWEKSHFELDPAAGRRAFNDNGIQIEWEEQLAVAKLKEPIVIDIPMSGLSVGAQIKVVAETFIVGHNDYASEGGAATYLRDPAEFGEGDAEGGIGFETKGLSMMPVETDLEEEPGGGPVPFCDPSTVERSVLEFDAPDYRIDESFGFPPYIQVTRSGSIDGFVTARVSITAGTAVAGEDFVQRDVIVAFGDQSGVPRTIELPLVDDDFEEGDETLTVTLHSPEGCADIGDQASANVIIAANDPSSGTIVFASDTYDSRTRPTARRVPRLECPPRRCSTLRAAMKAVTKAYNAVRAGIIEGRYAPAGVDQKRSQRLLRHFTFRDAA